jgi:hypothetical protein
MADKMPLADFWQITRVGLAIILIAIFCGIAWGSCNAASVLIQRLAQ